MIGRIAVVLVAVALAAAATLFWANAQVHAPLQLPEDGLALEIERGSSLTAVAAELAEQGALEYPRLLAWYGRLQGSAARIQAGEYVLEPGTTGASMLTQLVDGKVRLHALTVVEGWTVTELLAALAAHPAIAEVCVVGVDDEVMGERIGVAVVPKPGETVELEDLTEFLKSRGMAVFKLPEKLVRVDTMPYNATGKIQRRDVKAFFE